MSFFATIFMSKNTFAKMRNMLYFLHEQTQQERYDKNPGSNQHIPRLRQGHALGNIQVSREERQMADASGPIRRRPHCGTDFVGARQGIYGNHRDIPMFERGSRGSCRHTASDSSRQCPVPYSPQPHRSDRRHPQRQRGDRAQGRDALSQKRQLFVVCVHFEISGQLVSRAMRRLQKGLVAKRQIMRRTYARIPFLRIGRQYRHAGDFAPRAAEAGGRLRIQR